MIKDKNQEEVKLNKENIFENDLSSLSFGIFSNIYLPNNPNLNDKITINDSCGNNSKDSIDLKFPETFNEQNQFNTNLINYKRIYPDEVGQEIQCQMKIRKSKNKNNVNNLKKICDSHDELKKLVSKYSVFDVVKVIIQITNNMTIEGEKDKLIFNQIQTILKKFNNKEDITLLLLSVLNDKFSKEESKEETSNNNMICLDEEESNENNDTNSNDNDISSESEKNIYEYIIVLKKYKKYIHSYKLTNTDKLTNIITPCIDKDCNALCHVTANKIYPKGKHNHKESSKSISKFESKYPTLVNNPSWKYAKIVKYNGKEIVKLFFN